MTSAEKTILILNSKGKQVKGLGGFRQPPGVELSFSLVRAGLKPAHTAGAANMKGRNAVYPRPFGSRGGTTLAREIAQFGSEFFVI